MWLRTSKKGNDGSMDSTETQDTRIRSQMKTLIFTKQCFFYVDASKPIHPKHPHCWDWVVHRECVSVSDAPPFKVLVLCYCAGRNVAKDREAVMRCNGVDMT